MARSRSGWPTVAAGGQVEVKLATTDTFTIVGHSPSGNDFRIVRGSGGTRHPHLHDRGPRGLSRLVAMVSGGTSRPRAEERRA